MQDNVITAPSIFEKFEKQSGEHLECWLNAKWDSSQEVRAKIEDLCLKIKSLSSDVAFSLYCFVSVKDKRRQRSWKRN